MGNKIITEKDFWICSEGNMPAPFQGTRLGLKKKSGDIYITTEDKSTSSCVDFSCKKYMLLMAIAAAVLVVGAILLGVLTVATGGAALIAIGALAGLAGAAIGAVVGALLCGQKMSGKRTWVGGKQNFISQGTQTITGDHVMTCPIGGVITFAPQIKNWSQALSMGAANYIGGLMEGMMAGAAVGMGGAALSGGAAAMSGGAGLRGLSQAALQFAKSMPKNFLVNAVQSFGKFGLALRGVLGAQNAAATYGNTGTAGAGDFTSGFFSMETGAAQSVKNVFTGNGSWQDFAGIALMFSPVGKGVQDLEGKGKPKAEEPGSSKAEEAETQKPEDENSKPQPDAQETEAARQEGDGAYEAEKVPLTREQAIIESRDAYNKATNNAGKLPDSQNGKTTASDGINTVSGYAPDRISQKTRTNMGGVTDVPPQDVINHSNNINHTLNENASIDNGVPGQASASHAEKQVMTNKPGDPVGVSRPMCSNCREFAQKQADALGQDVVVTDPNGTHIFEPGGTEPIDIGWDPID
ncbi:hypothetical protein [Niabella sp.]|uniref:hypothetical protein n=1 Tax=Niabella sp. TaxID=1962976 RepID=UPI00261BDFD7|nr:hypothetical protein [Niabella sp.]